MAAASAFASLRPPAWLAWLAYALALALAPLFFSQGGGLSVLAQMGAAMVLALSYNILLGQGGMLSFGHAVYSGFGAYVAIHAMNLAAAGKLPLPVSLVPLAGGLGGMFFGGVFGYLSTRKSGMAFAMITLGLGELVYASALMFPGFFGGEGGVPANRVIGEPVLGISFGPQIEVYWLVAAWLFACTAAMYAFTRTPLGRVLNAVRDNPERAAFLGYDPRHVRFLALLLSAFFAGVAGGLAALNFEIASAESVGTARSAGVLLACFIGGIGYFWGPLLGGIVGVLLTVVLSSYTPAWQLYLGAVFMLLVMCAPDGLAGLLTRLGQRAQVLLQTLRGICADEGAPRTVAQSRQAAAVAVLRRLALEGAACLAALFGAVLLVELLYRRGADAADGTTVRLLGLGFDAGAAWPWLLAATCLATAWMVFRGLRRGQQ